MTTSKTCDYCDKIGVPILPLRYAVAPSGSGAPKAEGPSIVLSSSAAHYTRRLLRSGYLYVFDEARDRWDTYFVTSQALFVRIANTPGIPPVLPNKPFDCAEKGHRELASCITISDAKNATNVWLGFSDAQWTDKVQKLHSSAAYRKRHMRCVDVKAFAASADKSHCTGIHSIGKDVAEYAMTKTDGHNALSWSPFQLENSHGRDKNLIEKAENLAPGKGFCVVLSDPAGVAAELGALMQRNLNLFTNAKVRNREVATSAAIGQLEAAVRAQAHAGEEEAAERLANEMLSQPDIGMLFDGYRARKLKQIEELRDVTPAEAKRAGDYAWAKYSEKFDHVAAKNWQTNFNKELQAYDSKFIAPLATAHVSWMKSKAMESCFECNHDDSSADSGVVYAKTLQLCLGSTQDKAACFDLYTEWLNGSVEDKTNLLLRGLTLNLDKTAKDIQGAMKVSLDWRGFPLDQVIGGFGKSVESLAKGSPDVVAAKLTDAVGKLAARVLGPITKLIGQGYDGKVRAGLVVLGLYTQKTFAVVDVSGKTKTFKAALTRDLLKLSGQPLNQKQVERAVAVELKRLKMEGLDLEGTDNKKILLMVDPEQMKAMPKGLDAQSSAKWAANAIRTPQQLEALQMSDWTKKVRNPTTAALKGSIPFISGLVAAAIQYNAVQKLSEDEGKSMSHESTEAKYRKFAGIAAVAGTMTELVGLGVEKIAPVIPKFAKGLGGLGFWVGIGGKVLGIAGAVVMAGWDFKQGISNLSDGNTAVGISYIASGILGISAAYFLVISTAAAATGIGLILVAILIAVVVLIEYLKDNKIQDWLERCTWGKGPDARYTTLEEEMAQLKIATA